MNAARNFNLRMVGTVLALAAVITIIGALAGSDAARAQGFRPTASLTLSNPTPDAGSDLESAFAVPKPNLQFGGTVNFTPRQWVVARDADIPDGAIVAQLTSNATLGLIGGACNSSLLVGFDMLDATTVFNVNDPSTLIPFEDPEVAAG